MTLETFLDQLRQSPEKTTFEACMAVIEDHYTFSETAFTNGDTDNAAGQNNGSCKIFAFAQLNGLSETETLECFGRYYREDVLQNPDGGDHQNIRNFMKTGWDGIKFDGAALSPKA